MTSPTNKLFLGSEIRRLRIKHAMTQAELANAIGCKSITITFWETGRLAPKLPNIKKLAQLFGVPVTEFTRFIGD